MCLERRPQKLQVPIVNIFVVAQVQRSKEVCSKKLTLVLFILQLLLSPIPLYFCNFKWKFCQLTRTQYILCICIKKYTYVIIWCKINYEWRHACGIRQHWWNIAGRDTILWRRRKKILATDKTDLCNETRLPFSSVWRNSCLILMNNYWVILTTLLLCMYLYVCQNLTKGKRGLTWDNGQSVFSRGDKFNWKMTLYNRP